MIQTALREIRRGTAEIIDEARLETLLKNYFEKGETYTVKAGFDPTAPDLHLGHTVLLQKLAAFQKFGGHIQFLIGDFTAQIGDPTGKSETRKKLLPAQIQENAQSYKTQVFKILDPEKTTVVFNADWINPLGAAGMLELTTTYNVARMLERDDFDKRHKAGISISISEFLYPLLQGYDSVHLRSDIEIGGTDQKFNLLMGRHLQRVYEIGKEQAVLMMPILEGLDGVQKMSKSLGNYIAVADEPNEMFGKILSVSDTLMWRYYELLSTQSLDEIEALKTGVENGSLHPKKVKEALALEITERFHSNEAALGAQAEFERVHAQSEIPSEMDEFTLQGPIWIAKALVDCALSPSTSQARREIKQGSVKIDQNKLSDEQYRLELGEYILQVGKRKFARLKVTQ
ncbi:tyrosine--tRNA ligase [Sulfuricurvum sp. RIFCSPLOWO2_12_FULL_43_24]|uniref:tyrosine--tRNA ligase n=1 Tax=Sulfuricurvum sp. RIFCSPLOWO2_12_FULL_43_24 TaxID=1802247 RepID=UPI0008D7388D|nr:tyrosine--tRNA ligase [Sulfuricurvum sp. RIFCSPLOWO2_12_FULL_43_24]OHD86343.1 MAG: tyrosine--tRNA ligase [Sulfuricurvum sp. RIFCSPLOWO2_02_FULL_43_45]OHD88259.1 MAG: tyrosine--tRNA ligase [Sulfuricurvum sp. RIFCSPLOWO2_12_FULL_43_24]